MSADWPEPRAELIPPPVHLLSPSAPTSPVPSGGSRPNLPPPLPPRPSQINISTPLPEENPESESEPEQVPDTLRSSKDEEDLSDVQLLQLYDDEEIDRFLHLFSTYVREVRIAEPATPGRVAHEASLSAPTLVLPGTPVSDGPVPGATQQPSPSWNTLTAERIAHDFLLPLLPEPRPPLPDFSLSRLKQTLQRLYVIVEPLYGKIAIPLVKLATWENPRKSFVYCALYWVLWYHGLLLSAVMMRLLYQHMRWKLHPYPSLTELRDHRSRIINSQKFGRILSTRLVASPSLILGLRDMWDLFGDYRHLRKLEKMAQGKTNALDGGEAANDESGIRSASYSTPDLTDSGLAKREAEEEADLKRVGLFLMNEVADLLERVKNIFLWRRPGASAYFGLVLLAYFFLGLLPARYLVKAVGFVVGGIFWHVTPVLAAIPRSERNRLPSPLWIVPTDTEYAMELISQRVARGLPVRPKRRRRPRQSSDMSVLSATEREAAASTSVDWNKWGGRIASTKERAGEIKQMFQDGQWKQPENWKSLNPLAPKVVPPQAGSEPRIETETFPAQLKQNPGLITLTPTTLIFTPLFSSRAPLVIQLVDVTAVKKTRLTNGIELHYTESQEDGSREGKEANFLFVGSRTELFAKLVSSGGKKWAKV